jgi:hypothetical protein
LIILHLSSTPNVLSINTMQVKDVFSLILHLCFTSIVLNMCELQVKARCIEVVKHRGYPSLLTILEM